MKARDYQRIGRIGGVGLMLIAAVAGIWETPRACAGDPKLITVDVIPGKTRDTNVGCGFGDLSDDTYVLEIQLKPIAQIGNSDIE